jgi:hypothetical protein
MPHTIPPLEDLTSVLVTIVGRDLNARRIADWTGLNRERVRAAIRELDRREVVRLLGNGYWKGKQRTCAACQGSPVGGLEVQFDPETLRWYCAACWEQEAERLRMMVHD